MKSFNNLGINPLVEDILKQQGIEQPTPIQEKAIPEVIGGKGCHCKSTNRNRKNVSLFTADFTKSRFQRRLYSGVNCHAHKRAGVANYSRDSEICREDG